MLTNQSIGYMDAPIPKGLDLKEEINRMRREKNAVILAHYYQTGDIQDIADFVGDSLALAQQAAKTTADIIVFCGVHFMGETAKVLCPDKKVLVPDLNAGCSLADSCPAVDFAEFVKQHPGHVVISYVNTTAAVDSRKFSGRHEDYLRPRPELRQLHKWYYRTQDGALGWCLPCA